MVKGLLDHGAYVHAVDKVGRCDVLLDGRVRGVHHVLYHLYTYTSVLMAPYSYLSQNQQTALHMAIKRGHHETVQLLLERGADPNRQDGVRVVYI